MRATLSILAVAVLLAACDSDGIRPTEEHEITHLVDIDDEGRILVTLEDTVTGLAGILENGRITLLPRPRDGMVIMSVNDVNEVGRVVGTVRLTSGQRVPFVWQPGMSQLLVLTPPNQHNHFANAINDAGTIVGTVLLGPELNPERVPFVWTQGNNYQQLSPPVSGGDWRWSGANDINNNGQVVGWYDADDDAGLIISGFSWTPTGGFTRIEGVATYQERGQTVPSAVNEVGQVTGVNTDTMPRGFVWSMTEPMRSVGAGPSRPSCAHDINDSGDVVGEIRSPTSNVTQLAFIWNASTGFTILSPDVERAYATAKRVNNRGQVIGYIDRSGIGGTVEHFVWSRATGMQILGRGRVNRASWLPVAERRISRLSVGC